MIWCKTPGASLSAKSTHHTIERYVRDFSNLAMQSVRYVLHDVDILWAAHSAFVADLTFEKFWINGKDLFQTWSKLA
jgi:hypothetical protein